jgi:hypothetical protein
MKRGDAMEPRRVADCFEHSDESFAALIDAIHALGFDRETAGQYAVWIGDCPIFDADGKVVVMDKGAVIDRIDLNYFDKPQPKKAKAIPPGTLRCFPPAEDYYIRHHRERLARDLAPRIAALGYDEKTASRFASLISRNPCQTSDSKIAVVDLSDGGLKELVHLDLNLFPGGLFITIEPQGKPDPIGE